MGNIFLGKGTSLGVAIGIFGLFVLAIIAIHVLATGISLKRPRAVQNKLGTVIEPVRLALFGRIVQDFIIQNQILHLFFDQMVTLQILKNTNNYWIIILLTGSSKFMGWLTILLNFPLQTYML